jgi:hypothetical protein
VAGPALPITIDTDYADVADDPAAKLHQQHHDLIHEIVNKFDRVTPTIGGSILYWSTGGVYTVGNLDNLADGTAYKKVTTAQRDAIAGIASTYAPINHGHAVTDINGLTPALNAKSDVGHTHPIDSISGLADALAGKANVALAISGILYAGVNPPANSIVGSLWAVRTGTAPTNVVTPAMVGTPTSTVSNSTTMVVPLPVGAAAGDTAIFTHVHNSTDGAATPAARPDYAYLPAGWTGQGTATIGADRRMENYSKVLTATDVSNGSVTITYLAIQRTVGIIQIWRNVTTVTGALVSRITSETAKVVPNITLTAPSIYLTMYGERRTDPIQSITQPTGTVQDLFAAHPAAVSGGTAGAIAHMTATQPAGTITGGTWTIPVASTTSFLAAVALVVAT